LHDLTIVSRAAVFPNGSRACARRYYRCRRR
jgi:hypothetical protein